MCKEDFVKDKPKGKKGRLVVINNLYQHMLKMHLESFGKDLINGVEKSNRPPVS